LTFLEPVLDGFGWARRAALLPWALLCACDGTPGPSSVSPVPAAAPIGPESADTTTTPPEPAAPTPAPAWNFFARAFLVDKHYSHGIAVRRKAPDSSPKASCGQEEFIVANGHDHSPQFAAVVSLFSDSCRPAPDPTAWSGRALHFADVAAADLYGDGADEVVLASLAGRPGQTLDTGQVLLLEQPGNQTALKPSAGKEIELATGYGASSLAIGDVDEDGDLDLLVGSFWAPESLKDPALELKTNEVDVPRTIIMKPCAAVAPSRALVKTVPPRQIEARGSGASIFGFPFGSGPDDDDVDAGALDLGPEAQIRNVPVEAIAREEEPLGLHNEPQGPVFVYLQTRPGEFTKPARWIASPGAVDLHLADIDGDGHLDLLTGGRDVRVMYGPLVGGQGPIEVHRLPWSGINSGKILVHSLDVAFVDAGEGRKEVVVAANEGCYQDEECKKCGHGVSVWTAPRTGTRPSGWKQFFRPTRGLATALSFSSLDGDKRPDLVVGRMLNSDTTDCSCDHRVEALGGCVGAPLIAFRGSDDGTRGWLNEQADRIDITDGKTSLSPMSFRILPYAVQKLRDAATSDTVTHSIDGTAATYTGAGHVVNVAAVKSAAGKPLRFRHGHGERHITLAAPHHGEVTVEWRIVDRPGFLVTSVSPLRDETGPSFLAMPYKPVETGG
jgi:hypothetical protein